MHLDYHPHLGESFEIEYDPDNPICNSAPGQTGTLRNPRTLIPHLVVVAVVAVALYIKFKYF